MPTVSRAILFLCLACSAWAQGGRGGYSPPTGAAASGMVLVNCGGVDDTAAIQAKLTAAGGHIMLAAGTCVISSPLVIYSNTWLDAGRATIRQSVTGVGGIVQLLGNYANSVSNRTITDAAINVSTSATTLTSATAAFTSADLGSSLYVAGADYAGQRLCVTITAIGSGTSVTISRAATTTVSGASATVYRRDSNILVTGGIWTYPVSGEGFFFAKIDGLTIKDSVIQVSSSDVGTQCVTFGDATNVWIERVATNFSAAGFAVRGPALNVTFRDVSGATTDDLVAILAHELIGGSFDWARGPITNVLIDGVYETPYPPGTSGGGGSTLNGSKVALIGGNPACPLANIVVKNVFELLGTQPMIRVASDSALGGYTAISGLLIDGVWAGPGNILPIWLWPTNGKDVTIRNVWQSPTIASAHTIQLTSGASWDSIDISGITFSTSVGGASPVFIAAGATVGSLSVRNVQYDNSTTGTLNVPLLEIRGTVGSLFWEDFRSTSTIAFPPILVHLGGTVASLTSPLLHGNAIQSASDLTQGVWATVGATVTATQITVTSSGGNFVKQAINVTPNSAYVFTFLAKSGSLTAPLFAVYDNTNSNFIVAATSYASQINGSTWTVVSVPFFTTAGCTSVSVYPMSNGTTTGTVNVMNIAVQ